MPRLDARTTGDLVRLLVFMVTTAIATSLLVITIGNLSFGGSREYKAEFTDATGVNPGDDVRIAGVKVGSVQKVEVVTEDGDDTGMAIVTFTVDEDTMLDDTTNADIKYRNLIGQRYMSLTGIGGGEALDDGATIPASQTSPALDLTVLFNGFKPLFQALSPDDVNKLSFEIVQVFQGEGGTLESLLQSTASISSTLADNDQVIGQLIDNLSYVLDRVADRDDQLSALITSFRDLVGGLTDDRRAILSSLDGISDLAVETAGLVDSIREPLVQDIRELRGVTKTLADGRAEIDRALQVMPIKLNKMGRTATYGSWFNFYLCNFRATVRIGDRTILRPNVSFGADRCDLASEVGQG